MQVNSTKLPALTKVMFRVATGVMYSRIVELSRPASLMAVH